ncbi:MAG TPA: hypothetical protein VGH91_14875 [Gammaproteobacteria bacterium]|jgi:hypothetical protein
MYRIMALLTMSLALVWLLALSGMCITSYWECNFYPLSSISEAWVPLTILFLVFLAVALLFLMTMSFVIRCISFDSNFLREFAVFMTGAIVGTVPGIILHMFTGQGIGALVPQIEYVPLALPSGIGSVILAYFLKNKRYGGDEIRKLVS